MYPEVAPFSPLPVRSQGGYLSCRRYLSDPQRERRWNSPVGTGTELGRSSSGDSVGQNLGLGLFIQAQVICISRPSQLAPLRKACFWGLGLLAAAQVCLPGVSQQSWRGALLPALQQERSVGFVLGVCICWASLCYLPYEYIQRGIRIYGHWTRMWTLPPRALLLLHILVLQYM